MRTILTILRRIVGLPPKPYFATKDVVIGKHTSFGMNVVFNCERVRIGDGVRFGSNIRVDSTTFEIGDYGTVYDFCFFPGPGELRIGHNFWVGTASIIDAQGGTQIANNVGIGAQSQLWGHMKFGDIMAGCRFNSVKPLVIEDDAWLVGHCLVSPVHIGARSLAMLGSVVTHDMAADRVYAGVPAKDVTEKLGSQFRATGPEERLAYLKERLAEFSGITGLGDQLSRYVIAVKDLQELDRPRADQTVLIVSDRTYLKSGTDLEAELMRFLLPGAKFVPLENPWKN